jgi:hypothetical protein
MEIIEFEFSLRNIRIDEPFKNMFVADTEEHTNVLYDFLQTNLTPEGGMSVPFLETARMFMSMEKCYFFSVFGTYLECLSTLQSHFYSSFERYHIDKNKQFYEYVVLTCADGVVLEHADDIYDVIFNYIPISNSLNVGLIKSFQINEQYNSENHIKVEVLFWHKEY